MIARDLCIRVGQRIGMSGSAVHTVLMAIINETKEVVREGDEIRYPGFGKFFCDVLPAGPCIDKFLLAEGKEVIYDLPERKRARFIPEESNIDIKFKYFDSLRMDLNQ